MAATAQFRIQTLHPRFQADIGKIPTARAEIHPADDPCSRAQQLLSLKIEYIPSPEFEHPRAAKSIMNDLNDIQPARKPTIPAGLPTYLAALYDTPLLSPTREVHLFRKFNFLKFRASRLRDQLKPKRPSAKVLSEIEHCLAEAGRVRDDIVRANLRLVVANARIFADQTHVFEDLVSDGNLSLIQAVEKFDYSRGFRFSTYATHAIRRTYYRRIQRKQVERTRLQFTSPEILQESPQHEPDDRHGPADALLYGRLVNLMEQRLDSRELAILRARFSLIDAAESPTLQTLAHELGICKERVRQLQNRAVEKLRALALEITSEIDLDSVTMETVNSTGSAPE